MGKAWSWLEFLLLWQALFSFKISYIGNIGSQGWGSKGHNQVQEVALETREPCPSVTGLGSAPFQPAQGKWAICIFVAGMVILTPPIWFPHRNRARNTCCCSAASRESADFLWLMSIICGHHAGGDWQSNTGSERVTPLSIQRVFWNALNMLVLVLVQERGMRKTHCLANSAAFCPACSFLKGVWFKCPLGWVESISGSALVS